MILQERALVDLEVRGQEYPPPPNNVMMSQVVFYFQMGLLALVLAGDKVLESFKMDPPAAWETVKNNKFAALMLIWFLGNSISQSLLKTSAFEIQHGDTLVWSSLQEGRLPNMGDLVRAFKATGVDFMRSRPEEA